MRFWPGTCTFHLVWNRIGVFTDGIKLRILRLGDHLGLFGWAVNAITHILTKKGGGGQLDADTEQKETA